MANLQVKNVPDELYDELRARAAAARTTVREYVLRLVEADVAAPSMADWLAEVRAARPAHPPAGTAVRAALDAAADELDGLDETGRRGGATG